MVPGAVICHLSFVIFYIVAFTVVYWVTTFTLNVFTSVPDLARVPASGVAGVSFVLGGVWIAPTYRGATSVGLFTLNPSLPT